MAVGTYRAISVNGVLDLLTKANIPVVVLDLSLDPLNNTPISTAIMGNMLGNIQQSQAMNQFRQKHLTYLSDKLKNNPFKRPNVLFERAAGFTPECCLSYGNGILMQRLAYKTLDAVKKRQVYALWHTFYDSPFGFIANLQMAKWLHPDRFSHLDADAIFHEYHTQFLPVKWASGYWVTLLEQDKE